MQTDKSQNSFTTEQLEEIAVKVRERLNVAETNFIDITELAEQMGIDVYEVDFENADLLGIFVNKDGEKYIYIDQDLSEGDKRYVIATQLAHVMLNHHENYTSEEYLADYKQPYKGCYTQEEFGAKSQAAILGSALIMPANLVKQAWEQFKNADVIAGNFKVSSRVAMLRLDNLGLI